jgi:hypothetical protein
MSSLANHQVARMQIQIASVPRQSRVDKDTVAQESMHIGES